MSTQINLLPRRLRNQQALKRTIVSGAILLLLVASGVGGLWWLARAAVTGENKSVQTIQHENEKKSGMVTEVSATSVLKNSDTLTRITQLNLLSSQEVNWSHAVTLVGTLLPDTVQITTYSYANAAGKVTLQFTGTADSAIHFAQFVQGLQANTELTSVTVSSYGYQPVSGAVSFSMTIAVTPTTILYQKSSPSPHVR